MNLKKFVLGLTIIGLMAAQTACMADNVPDSVIRTLVGKYKAQNYTGCVQMSEDIIKNRSQKI